MTKYTGTYTISNGVDYRKCSILCFYHFFCHNQSRSSLSIIGNVWWYPLKMGPYGLGINLSSLLGFFAADLCWSHWSHSSVLHTQTHLMNLGISTCQELKSFNERCWSDSSDLFQKAAESHFASCCNQVCNKGGTHSMFLSLFCYQRLSWYIQKSHDPI